MAEDIFDAIIVGGGVAGATAALVLARAGCDVLVVERGNFAGSKNMTGGVCMLIVWNRLFLDLQKRRLWSGWLLEKK